VQARIAHQIILISYDLLSRIQVLLWNCFLLFVKSRRKMFSKFLDFIDFDIDMNSMKNVISNKTEYWIMETENNEIIK